MMPPSYHLDTNAISDAMKGQSNLIAKLVLKKGSVITSVVVKGEISYGLDVLPRGKRRTDLEGKAASIFSTLRIEPVTEIVAAHYAAIRSATEKQGFVMGDNDLWIAATALTVGAIVVTRDRALSQVSGLPVEDWTT